KYLDAIKQGHAELVLHKQMNYVPGISIAVSINGNLVWSEGLGLASTDLNAPATRETKYRIGEISEVFTALAFNILVEKNKLDPDSTVHYYLPEFPTKKWDINLRHLVNQSSGIRIETIKEENWTGLRNTIQSGLATFSNDTLLFDPGFFQLLSMFNYNLLGAIIEKTENKKFKEVINELIIDTLGLSNTVPDNPFVTIKGRADFFDHNYISQVINATSTDLSHKLPSRGYLSTAEDLVKLGNAFLFSEYISDSIKSKTFVVDEFPGGPSNWTNGWYIVDSRSGKKIYGSKGSVAGGGSGLLIYPNEKLVIAITTNLTDNSSGLPIFKIANFFINFIEKKDL
ncbi:MAG: beta-lactamase family protein, partial [Mariniphaga sp.]|nr:beta-lactamase family protein [Mariniphaga sp.]